MLKEYIIEKNLQKEYDNLIDKMLKKYIENNNITDNQDKPKDLEKTNDYQILNNSKDSNIQNSFKQNINNTNNVIMNLLDDVINKILEEQEQEQEQNINIEQKIVSYTFQEFKIPIKITIYLVDKFLTKDNNNNPPIGMYL